jgi:hypothetical protein
VRVAQITRFLKDSAMKPKRCWWVLGGLAVICGHLNAAEPELLSVSPGPAAVVRAQKPDQPATPQAPAPPQGQPAPAPGQPAAPQPAQAAPQATAPSPTDTAAPTTDAYSQAPPAGGEAGASANPNMFGDSLSPFTTVSGQRLPVVSPGSFKLADNGSPFPHDNYGVQYQYYSNVSSTNGSPRNFLHLETLDIEQSFFCKFLSIEARLPFTQLDAGPNGQDTVGDLNLIYKQVLCKGECDRTLLSGGVSVVVPTGNSIFYDLPDGTTTRFHTTLFQPFLAYFVDCPCHGWFLQGFTSAELSADPRFPEFVFVDVGLSKWLYYTHCCKCLTGVAGTVEFHSNTAVSNAGLYRLQNAASATAAALEEITITAGLSFVLNHRSEIGFAANMPVMGPRPYDYEFITHINLKF